jgi:L-lactate dehydrogenase complex protein LldG
MNGDKGTDTLYDQFRTRAEGVSAEVHRCASEDEALAFIIQFLHREGVADAPQSSALWADGPVRDRIDRQALQGIAGLKFEVTRELAADARVGISQAEWALANTGTLVQDSTAIDQRLVSSLPAIHIALVPTTGILPDMTALLEKLDPKKTGYIAMITGPSRTADIERVLTIGVHGPERLVIVVIDEMGGTN